MPKKKDEKLPDPKEHKWCRHKECIKKLRLSQKQFKEGRSVWPVEFPSDAIFLEDYCWEHLPNKAKAGYKNKIEKWIKAGHSLEGANFNQADLRELNFRGARLSGAFFIATDLRRSIFYEADLRGAWLCFAKLQEADFFRAELQGANFSHARLQQAQLAGAIVKETNFAYAKL